MRRVALLALLLLVPGLAACGGSDGGGGSYDALRTAAASYDEQARADAAKLQDCLNQAQDESAKVQCAQEGIAGYAEGWKPVAAALTALATAKGGDCASALDAAKADVPIISGAAQAPTTAADAEALPTELSNELDALAAAVSGAASAWG
jgi:hypothetical protein